MANEEHLKLARQGKDAWNKWRVENSDEPADFSGADFTLPENKDISFAEFEFGNHANFEGAVFGDEANFNGARFGYGARFGGMAFGDEANFNGATFGDCADFKGTAFGAGARFFDAMFRDEADFSGAAFEDEASFVRAVFWDETRFDGATFGHGASFNGATFGYGASFDGAAFVGEADFSGAAFGAWASFQSMTQDQIAEWRERTERSYSEETKALLAVLRKDTDPEGFSEIDFTRAKFHGPVYFKGRVLRDLAIFAHARFAQPPDFASAKGQENLSLVGTQFRFGRGVFLWTTDPSVVTQLRRLRGIAQNIHATDAERDLFILERMAERGVLWKNWWDGDWKSWLFGWWRPLAAMFLFSIYRASSNCGRSVVLPLGWLFVANYGASFVYGSLVPKAPHEQLWTLTLAGALPFGEVNKTALGKVAETLFEKGAIPPMVQALAIGQGIVNAVLVFLLALALRNHFKVK